MTPPEVPDLAVVERLTRVETKLDVLLNGKDTNHDELSGKLADHETRLRALESVRWKAAGISGFVAAAAAAIMSALAVRLIG